MRQGHLHTQRARELRREMTRTEKRLWPELRGRRFSGFKFRRQTPLAGFIADFYCARARLAIELDGESHVGQEARDKNRQQALESAGVKVLRFWDTAIYEDLDAVLEMIWRECCSRCEAPSPPTPLPLGRGEEESIATHYREYSMTDLPKNLA